MRAGTIVREARPEAGLSQRARARRAGGVDVTLIHEVLAMTPGQRLRRAAVEARNVEALVRRASRRE